MYISLYRLAMYFSLSLEAATKYVFSGDCYIHMHVCIVFQPNKLLLYFSKPGGCCMYLYHGFNRITQLDVNIYLIVTYMYVSTH